MLEEIIDEFCKKWDLDDPTTRGELREHLINFAIAAQMDSKIRDQLSREYLKSQIEETLRCKP